MSRGLHRMVFNYVVVIKDNVTVLHDNALSHGTMCIKHLTEDYIVSTNILRTTPWRRLDHIYWIHNQTTNYSIYNNQTVGWDHTWLALFCEIIACYQQYKIPLCQTYFCASFVKSVSGFAFWFDWPLHIKGAINDCYSADSFRVVL